jgi:heterodisulfide reductase subunit B
MSQANGHHYGYYPGCSMGASARAYELANHAIAGKLGLTFEEVEDWNCCGATEYFSLNSVPAYSLVARNLSLAADQGIVYLAVPCSACFLNLHKTDKYMGKFEDVNAKVNQALAAGGLHYDAGSMRIRHLLDVIVEDIGFDAIAEQVSQPLKGLRVAPYYGCLIVRPDSDAGYVGRYGGRLPPESALLRRAHDADQRRCGLRADPTPAGKCQRVRGGRDRDHLPDVPA